MINISELLFPLPQVVTGFQVQMHVYDIDNEIGIIMSQKGCIHLIKTTVNNNIVKYYYNFK